MKLLFAIKSMDVAGGGAERVLATVASELSRRGHDVAVLTFDAPGGASFYPLAPGVRRIALGLGPTDRASGTHDFVARIPALRRAVQAEKPDATIGFMHSMFVALAFATAGLGIPLVASEHIVPDHYRRRRREYALLLAAGLLATRITVLSPAVRDMYPPLLRGRMVPMPNPVATAAARSAGPAAHSESFTLLSVGRLEAQKDHATLVDAFASIAGRFREWTLRIVGEGTLRDALTHQIATLGLQNRVRLVGWTDDIGREYAAAHVFALPSRYESFGLATAEAMAAGLPVIGFSDCPGTNELVRHGENGWLVEASNPDRARSLADGLARLMSDAELRARLGAHGPRTVAVYDVASVVTQWEQLLAEVARK